MVILSKFVDTITFRCSVNTTPELWPTAEAQLKNLLFNLKKSDGKADCNPSKDQVDQYVKLGIHILGIYSHMVPGIGNVSKNICRVSLLSQLLCQNL